MELLECCTLRNPKVYEVVKRHSIEQRVRISRIKKAIYVLNRKQIAVNIWQACHSLASLRLSLVSTSGAWLTRKFTTTDIYQYYRVCVITGQERNLLTR